MTTSVKKALIITLLCAILVVTLFLGVFSFIPDFEVGKFDEYHSPASLIQKSSLFTDSVKTTYLVELDEDVEFASVQKILNKRLHKAFGYYGVKIDFDEANSVASITVPQTNNVNKTSANSVLQSITAVGNIEILNSSSYSESSVILTQEHFKRATVRNYIDSGNTFYICEVRLTTEGAAIAAAISSTNGYYAVDESVNGYPVRYSGSRLQIYAPSRTDADIIASYISTGALGASFTEDDSSVVENKATWVFPVIFALIVVASFVFFGVRYNKLGVVPMLMQLIAVVVFTIFAGLVYSEIFNMAAAIGVVLAYCFMTLGTVYTFDKIHARMQEKSYTAARYLSFEDTKIITLIAHGALLVLGIILWVIPTIVTAPLGNVLVYGAVLSFIVTFVLNRLFTLIVAPFFEDNSKKANARK